MAPANRRTGASSRHPFGRRPAARIARAHGATAPVAPCGPGTVADVPRPPPDRARNDVPRHDRGDGTFRDVTELASLGRSPFRDVGATRSDADNELFRNLGDGRAEAVPSRRPEPAAPDIQRRPVP